MKKALLMVAAMALFAAGSFFAARYVSGSTVATAAPPAAEAPAGETAASSPVPATDVAPASATAAPARVPPAGVVPPKIIDAEFEREIRALLKATGMEAEGRRSLGQVLQYFQKNNPQAPEEFWVRFAAKVNMAEFTDLMVPVFARHLTREDVRGLTAFYESPLGQRLLAAQAQISSEAMQAGLTWGQKLALQVQAELEKEGLKGK